MGAGGLGDRVQKSPLHTTDHSCSAFWSVEMPVGHAPGPRQDAGSRGALGQGRVNGGVRQSLQGGRRPGRQGQHLLMPRRVTQGDTQQAHGVGGCRRFLSSLLCFTLLTLCHQQRLFCNQKKKSLAEQGELLVRQGGHTTAEGPLSPPHGSGTPGMPQP